MVLRTRVSRRSRQFVKGTPKLVLKPGPWGPLDRSLKPKLLASTRQTASYALIITGTLLVLWVAGNYTVMYWKQRSLLQQWNRESVFQQNLTKLSIPKIGLEDVVLEGATQHSLLQGPAHLKDSVEPGSPGNAVIAGHRDTFFRHVHSLRRGDDIYVMRDGHRFHFVVMYRRIVQPTDLSVLRSANDTEITLITCYPTHVIGPAPERLVIVAKLASSGT
ncbi:MAG TPA: class D sortase [Terriglobales bacterium]